MNDATAQPHASAERVAVEAPCGRLTGKRTGEIIVFRGVPFAEPPVGPLRWRLPKPLAPWPGVREALRNGPICPQAPTQLEAIMGSSMGEQSEDCLYLNIWTPACDGAKRPVMVWFHGGAYVIGAGTQGIYNGKHLSALGDVVVVTTNYRLGALGFLNLADATDGRAPGSGSEGIADQIRALEWVRENIASFGGDPANVTIFGESAGAMSVACLMAAAPARGLFAKAILQSGAGHIGYSREKSARVARALLEELGIAPADAPRVCEASFAAIIKAQIAVLADARDGGDSRHLGRMPFQPAIDGTVLDRRPIEAIREGSAAGVPILTGTTREEWKLFTAPMPHLRLMTAKGLAKRVTGSFGEERGAAMLEAYREGSPYERWNALMTDRVFAVPAVRLLEAQTRYAPAYAYRFDWRSKFMGGIFGSCHALELAFVFGTNNARLANRFFGTGPEADALASTMMGAWAGFARAGTPETNLTGPWAPYDTEKQPVMIFGDGSPHIVSCYGEASRHAWNNVADKAIGT